MNPLRAILVTIAAEFRRQRLGRRSLREIQFAKYKVTPRLGDRNVQERLLRRMPKRLGKSALGSLTTC
jgi:hypothetical protein